MAMERIGLGGELTFDPSRGVQGMNRASKAFDNLHRKAQKTGTRFSRSLGELRESMSKAGQGLTRVGMAALPVSVGMGLGIAKAAQFESQMSKLKAVLRGISDEEFAQLTARAKELGIVSVFSAKQAAEGMENLAVLGFNTNEILASIQPTLDAAAVAGVDLASAALFVGGSVKAMGLEVKEAGRVADVLTTAGQKSATTLPLMAESLKLAAPAAKTANLSLEETVAVLGKLADAQLRGTLGATAFNNMMKQLAKPTSEAEKMIEKMGISLSDAEGNWRPIIDIVMDFNEALQEETNSVERSRKQAVLFGVRGARAFSALASAGKDATDRLQDQLVNSFGAAAEAAETRLDNLLGAFTLFGASLEGVAIGLFAPFLKAGKEAVQGVTNDLNNLLLAMDELKGVTDEGAGSWRKILDAQERYGESTTSMALGVHDALKMVGDGLKSIGEAMIFVGLASKEMFGGDSRRELTKWVVVLFLAAGVMGPLALGIRGVGFALQGLFWLGAPIPKLFKAIREIFIALSLTTVGSLTPAIKGLATAIKVKLVGAFKAVVAWGALMAAPIWIAVGALLVLIGVMKLTQIEGEGLIESFSKNWEIGFKSIKQTMIGFAQDTINLVISPIRAVAMMLALALEKTGKFKKQAAIFRDIAEKGVQFEAGVQQTLGAGVGRRVPFEPGGVAGAKKWSDVADRKQLQVETKETGGIGGDILKDLEKKIGDISKTQMERIEEMVKKSNEAVTATSKAAESAAQAAAKEKCARVSVDGREVARSVAKNQDEIEARSGAKATPWQRHQALVHGAIPVKR